MVLFILDRIKDMPPRQALEEIIDITHYEKHLETYAGDGDEGSLISRLENISELLSIAEGKETIEEFLEDCSLRTEDEDDDETEDREASVCPRSMPPKVSNSIPCFWSHARYNILPHWRSVDEDNGNFNGGNVEEERALLRRLHQGGAQPPYFLCQTCGKINGAESARF